jgi:hypothetical protein
MDMSALRFFFLLGARLICWTLLLHKGHKRIA